MHWIHSILCFFSPEKTCWFCQSLVWPWSAISSPRTSAGWARCSLACPAETSTERRDTTWHDVTLDSERSKKIESRRDPKLGTKTDRKTDPRGKFSKVKDIVPYSFTVTDPMTTSKQIAHSQYLHHTSILSQPYLNDLMKILATSPGAILTVLSFHSVFIFLYSFSKRRQGRSFASASLDLPRNPALSPSSSSSSSSPSSWAMDINKKQQPISHNDILWSLVSRFGEGNTRFPNPWQR